MKHISKLVLALLALSSSAWITTAQPVDAPPPEGDRPPPREGGPPDGPPGMRARRPPMPIIKALDANGDSVIDDVEIANAPAALKKLDKNEDAKLALTELLPPPPDGRPARPPEGAPSGAPPGARANRPPVLPIVAALDVNKDDVIDADEIANAAVALKKLDRNEDGKLALNEILPPRLGGPSGRGGKGGPGGPGGPDDRRGPPPAGDSPPPNRPPPDA